MSQDDLQLFDRAAARRRRERALVLPDEARFLHGDVRAQMKARLCAVERHFASVLEIGGAMAPLAPDLPQAEDRRIVRMEESDALALNLGAPDEAFRVAGTEDLLPFAPASFDLILAPLTLHRANDLPGTLIQLRRALKPDGLLLAALFGGDTLTELRRALLQAEAETGGGASPRVAPFAGLQDVAGLLQRAGLALPVADREVIQVAYGSLFSLFADLRAMGETNALAERRRTGLRRDTLARLAEIYAERFARADGRLLATFEIFYLHGWAPHASQQVPLRPGSARARLATALGTSEISAGERAGPNRPR